MAGLLSAVLILAGISANLWLMVHLMNIVRVVSAIQMAWGQAEGMVEAIPWLPFFVLIPVAAIIGTIYMSEKYLKVKKAAGLKGLLRFAFRVWSVQLLALAVGDALQVVFLPGMRTAGLIAKLLVLVIAAVVLMKLPQSSWGKRTLFEHQ